MTKKNLFNFIALKGMREQAYKFALGWKGGMKQCYTRGCEIFTPLGYALKGEEVSEAILIEQMHNGEVKINYDFFQS